MLSATERAKIRRQVGARVLAVDEAQGELSIVPFLDVIVNLMIFVLATIAITFTASIETRAPSANGIGIPDRGPNVTILVVREGFAIKASGGNVATGCEAEGSGLAVPTRNGQYDFAALTACARKLKLISPEIAESSQVFVTANSNVDYQTIISVVDAVQPSFPDVSFRVAR